MLLTVMIVLHRITRLYRSYGIIACISATILTSARALPAIPYGLPLMFVDQAALKIDPPYGPARDKTQPIVWPHFHPLLAAQQGREGLMGNSVFVNAGTRSRGQVVWEAGDDSNAYLHINVSISLTRRRCSGHFAALRKPGDPPQAVRGQYTPDLDVDKRKN